MDDTNFPPTVGYLARAQYEDSLDLSVLYPVSPFFVLKGFCLAAFGIALLSLPFLPGSRALKFLHDFDLESRIGGADWLPSASRDVLLLALTSLPRVLLYAAALVLASVFAYLVLYRQRLAYRLESGELRISKGVLFRDNAWVPLAHVSDVFIQRGVLDHLFGLAGVVLCVPGIFAERLIKIPALSYPDALALEECLSALIWGRRVEEPVRLARG